MMTPRDGREYSKTKPVLAKKLTVPVQVGFGRGEVNEGSIVCSG